jgi:type II secretory pathway component GspD/PulD (secretin)
VKTRLQPLGVAILALVLQSIIGAQEPGSPKPPTQKPATVATTPGGTSLPLRLQLVISKYQGDKKISSLPYSLSLNATGRASLRMGADVPYATNQITDGKSIPSYTYRSVGISIDGTVTVIEGGIHRVDLTVIDDSIDSQIKTPPSSSLAPVFRNFRTTGSVLLKDGQTTQLTTAADPISGEVMRVDVTLASVR